MKGLANINPGNNQGSTPLHGAAKSKEMSICQLIMINVKNKNPADNDGITPQMVAASDEYNRIILDLGVITYML